MKSIMTERIVKSVSELLSLEIIMYLDHGGVKSIEKPYRKNSVV